MPYNVKLKSEDGEYLRGVLYYFDAQGNEIGQTVIYPSGTDLDIDLINDAYYFRVVADGYGYYGNNIETLYDTNTITLVKNEPVLLYAIGGIVVGLLLGKYLF